MNEVDAMTSMIVFFFFLILQYSLFTGLKWNASLIFESMASLVAQWYRINLQMQGTWVSSLGQEDPLEKEMATHSSILAWEIPWTEEPGRL